MASEKQTMDLGAEIIALRRAEKLFEKTAHTNDTHRALLTETRRQLRQKRAEMKRLKKDTQGRLF